MYTSFKGRQGGDDYLISHVINTMRATIIYLRAFWLKPKWMQGDNPVLIFVPITRSNGAHNFGTSYAKTCDQLPDRPCRRDHSRQVGSSGSEVEVFHPTNQIEETLGGSRCSLV